MSDLSITAANVIAGAGATIHHKTAGATITAGQQVYLDPADGKMKLADSDSATAAARSPFGTALNGASNDQPLAVLSGGDIAIGAVLIPGTTYYLSATPGGICPFDDLGSGDYPVIVGIAESASVLSVKYQESGVALSA